MANDDRNIDARRPTSTVVFAVALLFAPALHAQQPDDCLDRAVTQAAINRCATEREARAEAAMDSVYARLMETVDDGRRDLLTGAQADWSAYRDAHCAFVAARYAGGSMMRNVIATCRARLAERRTRALGDELEALPPPER